MKVTTVGIDLAKNVMALSGANRNGRVVLRKQLRRARLLGFLGALEPCVVGLEACGGAHHFARAIARLGHQVKLMSPSWVAPYRKGQKHDRNDADAICEAVTRGNMRFVAQKTVAQQDLLALHRVRARLMKQRIALSNQMRALLNERGVVLRKGAAGLRAGVAAALADEHNQELSGTLREMLGELLAELHELELKLKHYDLRLAGAVKDDQRCVRLLAVPGVGPQIATALVATVGDAREFKSGRELSAFLGLTPRQHSTGGKTVLLGISKHGDRYLRTLLIHGARSLLYSYRRSAHPRAAWAARLSAARGPNVAAVALANHNARVLWALLRRGENYRAEVQARSFPARPSAAAALKRARAGKLLVVKPA
jgi:transposase